MNPTAPLFVAHDQGWLPWLVVGISLVAALIALAVRGQTEGRERWFWTIAALALFCIGINKQLDLQTLFTATLREMAREEGWYEARRSLQAGFLVVLAGGAALFSLWLAWLVRNLRPPVFVALAGLIGLAVFVLVRAASFHHLDVAMRERILGLKLYNVIEIGALLLAATGTLWAWFSKPPEGRRPGYRA